jgi:hypothetical protein
LDEDDRRFWLAALSEVCGRTGWRGGIDRSQSTYLDMARCDARVETWRATFDSNIPAHFTT